MMEASLVGLSLGAWTSAAIGVAARLGVADVLEDGPATSAELAKVLGVDPDATTPLMKALIEVGIFAQDEEGRFTNSALSEQLRTRHPESLRHVSILTTGLYAQAACGGLLQAVQTGKPALPFQFGVPLYEYLEQDAETARIFDRAMQELARPVGTTLAQHYPFQNERLVIDVGGGNGELLKGILSARPELRGICVDRPDTCRRAEANLRESEDHDLIERLTFHPADIFDECPGGGDLYILKNVLHDWSSESAVRILSNIGDAMRAGSGNDQNPVLLVIDPLLEYDAGASLRPLIKMVIGEKNTRERSAADMRRETAEAGLQILSITPLPPDLTVVACTLASQNFDG